MEDTVVSLFSSVEVNGYQPFYSPKNKQKKVFSYISSFDVQQKHKVTYILNGLKMSTLTAHFHFGVNYPILVSG